MENNNKICPICGKSYSDHSAISRVDNKTEICPECGLNEALLAWKEANKASLEYLEKLMKSREEGNHE